MTDNMRWLVIDVIPAPTHLGGPDRVVVGSAALLPGGMLAVTLAGGATFNLRVNPRNAVAVAKLVLRALWRQSTGWQSLMLGD